MDIKCDKGGGYYGVHRLDGPGMRRGEKVLLPPPGEPAWATLDEALAASSAAGYTTPTREELVGRERGTA